jgi:hypothetical protein
MSVPVLFASGWMFVSRIKMGPPTQENTKQANVLEIGEKRINVLSMILTAGLAWRPRDRFVTRRAPIYGEQDESQMQFRPGSSACSLDSTDTYMQSASTEQTA